MESADWIMEASPAVRAASSSRTLPEGPHEGGPLLGPNMLLGNWHKDHGSARLS